MTDSAQAFYVSTAIPFVNARPHLGFALELCIADALARHARSRGRSVFFATGTDDHSLKNVLAAERAGADVSDFVREHSQRFQQLAAALDISQDSFVSTSQHAEHAATVEALWRACQARGDLYRRSYDGLYCVGCERFADPDEARCPEHPDVLVRVSEDNWFFRLSRYAEPVRERIESGGLQLTPAAAREETLALLRAPLPDVCVSRSAARARGWGISVPDDPEQVIWVWFDALAYYLTALGFGSCERQAYKHFWQNDSARVHVIGKGITRFHALLWPTILASAGLAWPTDLLVHGYLTQEGVKISKSGAGFDPVPLIESFGAEAVRYYLLRHVRTTRDGDWKRERLTAAYNAELANGLGNLVDRVLALVQRASEGKVPAPSGPSQESELLAALRAAALALPETVDACFARFAVDEAARAVFDLVAECNRCLDHSAPWSLLRRGDQQGASAILRVVLEALAVIALELEPFLPSTARRLSTALGCRDESTRQPAAGLTLPAALKLFPRSEA
jgi:methionyl-tRNA synthetase